MSSPGNPFITEVKFKEGKVIVKESEQFERVRSDYVKLLEVVGKYNEKVALLQDKQRQEYSLAYEHHMINIQKELHSLREKATAIANDRTKDEKLMKLDTDTQNFRNDALRLDMSANELRKTLRSMTSTLQALERERDWLLKRLRHAKKKYKSLKSERESLVEFSNDNHSISQQSSNTLGDDTTGSHSYFLDLNDHSQNRFNQSITSMSQTLLDPTATPIATHKPVSWKERLDTDFIVTRADTLLFALPAASPVGKVGELRPRSREERRREVKAILGALVLAKARREALVEFLGQCRRYAAIGAWSTRSLAKRRTLTDTVRESVEALEEAARNDAFDMDRIGSLATRLAGHPETYDALQTMFRSQSQQVGVETVEPAALTLATSEETLHLEDLDHESPAVRQDREGALLVDNDILDYFNKGVRLA